MKFKEYLKECDCDIAEGAAMSTIIDEKTEDQINFLLDTDLDSPFLSPESGIQAIRKVLKRFDIELEALYDASPEGDELVLELENAYIYILYYLTDDNRYEFYAEVGDDETMNELMSDEETEEEK
jgi:hypothetical protein